MRPESLLDVEVAGEPQLSPDGARVLYVVTRPRLSPDGYASRSLAGAGGRRGAPPRRLLVTDAAPPVGPAGPPTGAGSRSSRTSATAPRSRCWTSTRCGSHSSRGAARSPPLPGRPTAATSPTARIRPAPTARPPGSARTPASPSATTRWAARGRGPGPPLVPAEGGLPRQVAGGPYTHVAPAYSPDGRWLACARVEHYSTYRHGGGEVWLFPAGGGEGRAHRRRRRLSPGHGARLVPGQPPSPLRELPHDDDRPDAAADARVPRRDVRRPRSPRASTGSSATVPGSHTDLRFGAGPVPVAASERLAYFCAGDGGAMPIFRVPLGGGAVEPVTPPGRLVRRRVQPGALGPPRLHGDGRRARRTRSSALDPGGAPRRLTEVGQAFWRRVPPASRWSASPCRVATASRPKAGSAGPPASAAPVPAVLHIHGGPHLQFGYTADLRHALWSTPAGRSSSSTRRGAAATATRSPRRCAATGAASTTRTRWRRSTSARSGAGSVPTVSR